MCLLHSCTRGAVVDGDDAEFGQKEIHCLVNNAKLVHNFS
jgi:hypothetical protein